MLASKAVNFGPYSNWRTEKNLLFTFIIRRYLYTNRFLRLKNITFEVTLEVEKDSEVYFIPALIWKRLAEKNISVKEFSMELVSERFSEVMWVMEQMISKNMGQRITAFLLEQSVLEGSQTLTLTHDIIAKNIGTAREVISRTLKYLENEGLLKLSRGQIQLIDMKKLNEISR